MPSLELYHTCRAKGRDSERCERVLLILFCFVLFALQLSVCLWWHDYRRDGFPTLKFKLRRGRRRRGCSYSEKDDIDPCIDGIDHSIEYGGSSAWHRAWHQAWHRAQHRARHRAWHRAWHEHVMMLGHATSTSTCNSHSHVLAYVLVLVLVRVEGKSQRVRSANRHWGRSNRPSDARSELARH